MSVDGKSRFTQIGLDRLVRLTWLEKTASLVLAGNGDDTIKTILQSDLSGFFRSDKPTVRGSIDKSLTILLKVWLRVPAELESLRKEGLEHLKHLQDNQRLLIHWGMVMASYPFWASVATQTGRLLKLQSSATAVHVQRRVREQYGERETVSRRTRYVLRSYVDWEVLSETENKGIYKAPPPLSIEDPRLIAWIIEASLHANPNRSAPLKDLLNSPGLFPFRLKSIHAESLLGASSRLDILRHGLDDNLVMLKATKGDSHG